MGRFAGRFISSVVLAGLIPACGGGPGSSPPPASATVLFFEGWDSLVPPGGGPTSQWTGFLATGNGTLAGGVDSTGDPFLFLLCTERGGGESTISATALPDVALEAPFITISADVAASHQDEGVGSFVISAAGASARADFDALSGQIVVSITIGGTTTTSTFSPSAPFGPFHRVEFSVDGAENASWAVDGTLLPVTIGPWPAGQVAITVAATYSPAGFNPGPQFDFDNILATTP